MLCLYSHLHVWLKIKILQIKDGFRYSSRFLRLFSTGLGCSLISHRSPVLGLVVHACNPCTREAKARELPTVVPSQSGYGADLISERRHMGLWLCWRGLPHSQEALGSIPIDAKTNENFLKEL